MVEYISGLDISNHQGRVSAQMAQCWRDQGVQYVVIRASLENQAFIEIAHQQTEACRAVGLITDFYPWCYPKADAPREFAERVLDTYGKWGAQWYWLDLEDEDGWSFDNAAQNIEWLHWALEGFDAAGAQAGIYTGRWYWQKPNRFANTHEFKDRALWNGAEYNGYPDFDHWTPYGGWDTLVGRQYMIGMVCGQSLDLNVFDRARVTPPTAEDDMAYRDSLSDVAGRVAPMQMDEAYKILAVCDLPEEVRTIVQAGLIPQTQFIMDQHPDGPVTYDPDREEVASATGEVAQQSRPEPEHQDRDGDRQAAEASRGDRPAHAAAGESQDREGVRKPTITFDKPKATAPKVEGRKRK